MIWPLWPLVIRNWRGRPLRHLPATAVILAGTALVMTTAAALDCARATFQRNLSALIGNVDIRIRPIGSRRLLPPGVLTRVRRYQQVEWAGGIRIAHLEIAHGSHARVARIVGLSRTALRRFHFFTLAAGRRLSGQTRQVVLDGALARRLHLRVHGLVMLTEAANRSVPAVVVGLTHRSVIGRFVEQPTCYAPLALLPPLARAGRKFSEIDIKIRRGIYSAIFSRELQKQIPTAAGIRVRPADQARRAFASVRGVFRKLLWLVSLPIAMGAALLILVVMTMGKHERVRFFGRLRCLGASRAQVLTLAALEASVPAVAGTAAGIACGFPATRLLRWHFPSIFAVYHVGAGAVWAALLTGLTASAIGILIPLAQAWRSEPMAAVCIAGAGPARRRIWPLALAGISAVGAQMLLWHIGNAVTAVWLYALVGAPLLLFAAAMFAPPMVVWLEKPASAILARIWGVRRELLRGVWSRAPYRSGAATAALLVGVAFFVALRSRGDGLLQSWEFPAQFPDVVVFSPFQPLPAGRVAKLQARVSGVAAASALTAFWVQARVGGAPFRTMLFVAVEPRSFAKMIDLKFHPSNRKKALALLDRAAGVLVAAPAQRHEGLEPGRRITFQTPHGVVSLHIAGMVQSQGVNIARGYLRVQRIFHRISSLAIVGTLGEAEKFFDFTGVNALLVKVKPGWRGMAVLEAIKAYLGRPCKPSFLASVFNLQPLELHGATVRQMKRQLDRVVRRIMRALTIAAGLALILASVGVAALGAAAVRARRYEFGVLRALGARRGQIIRMILAEWTLPIGVAIVLGSLLGLYMSFMGTRVDHRLAGFASRFVIAWESLPVAAGGAAAVALLAVLAPAAQAAGVGIRALLARGRD